MNPILPSSAVLLPLLCIFGCSQLQSSNSASAQNLESRASHCLSVAQAAESLKDPKERDKMRNAAAADCDYVIKNGDGMLAANARDLKLLIFGYAPFPEVRNCPNDAKEVVAVADRYFRANRREESLPFFEQAVSRCPENSDYWVQYGHTVMSMGDLDRAKRLLEEAIKHNPWNRSGHFFLSELHRGLGRHQAAYDEAALAVVSDPKYELGWEQLKQTASLNGRGWRRTLNHRAVVFLDEQKKPIVLLPTDIVLESPEAQFWLGLSFVEVSELNEAKKTPDIGDVRTALEKDRARVEKNLDFQRSLIEKDPRKRSLMYDIVEDAYRKGYADEAIFISVFDRRLVAEFVEYRDTHKERLLTYISTIVAPPEPTKASTTGR